MSVFAENETLAYRTTNSSRADGFKNLALERYLEPLNRAQMKQDFYSLLLEMDVMKELIGGATVRQMFYVPGEGFYHDVNGELVKYTDFFDKAITDTTNRDSRERFSADRLGFTRTEKILEDSSVKMVIVASPPGSTYRFKNMVPLSATFGFERGEEGAMFVGTHEKRGYMFRAFAMYVDEIPSELHAAILNQVAQLTELDMDPLNPLSVVATPFILDRLIENLDKLVQSLGFKSWKQVEERALSLSLLNNERTDDKGERRSQIIQLLTETVDKSLKSTSSWNLDMVSEAVKRILAKEAIGHYVDKSIEVIRQDVLLTVMSLHKDSKITTKINELINPFAYSRWQIEQDRLLQTVMFQRMMSAHGGGSSMFGDKYDSLTSIDGRMTFLSKREKKKSECVKCHEQLDDNGKCTHCKK